MKEIEKLRVVLIVQARMGSERLPGKPLKKVLGKTLFEYLIERLRRVKYADEVVLATTTLPKDDPLAALSQSLKISYFRGSEEDVLDRFLQAGKFFRADVVVRISGDCPLIDPALIDEAIRFFLDHYPQYDHVSNCLNRTYPRGMDVEVFSMSSLEKVAKESSLPEEREHVTVYYYRHPETFVLGSLEGKRDLSHYRWTVDTQEDFMLISKMLENIYPSTPEFTLADLLRASEAHPEWRLINAHVQQKPLTKS